MAVTYRWKTRPYTHQVRMVKFALRKFKAGDRGVAFLCEPRTGKTKATIDTIGCLHAMYGLKKVVVICPARVMGVWAQEIAVHSSLVVRVTIWDADARAHPLPAAMGPYDLDLVIVNYDAFGTPGKRLPSGRRSTANGRFKTRQKLQRWIGTAPALCVADEGHKLKNASGKAANMIVSMRDMFRWRMLLTGTPVTKAKRAFDIYMEWQFLNPQRFQLWGATESDFKNHTGRYTSANGFPQWLGPREQGMRDLQRGVHADAIVVMREDCFDLPPREHRIVPVKLTTSVRHYDEMAEYFVTELRNGKIAEASIPLVVTMRLLQITSGFVGIPETRVIRGEPQMVSVPHAIGTEKLRALKPILVDEILDRDQKIVIAARFTHDLNRIVKLCKSIGLPVWQIRGGLHRRQTDEAINEFRHHDWAGAMVVQPQAASLGIDLSTASHMLWYSLTPSFVDFSQCCDRIALSRTSTTFTYLIADGTVDELAYQTLLTDGEVTKAILANPDVIRRFPGLRNAMS